jgi:hypothetical protein
VDPKAERRSVLGWLAAAVLAPLELAEGPISPNGWCLEWEAPKK